MAWREECGVFGIWGHSEASRMTYLGLYALQHRGQESAGIISLDASGEHLEHKGLGLVADVFSETDLDRLKGSAAVGHVRYSTTGENLLTNAQPLTARLFSGPVALAHNGNIVNGMAIKNELKRTGSIFQGTSDTEVLLHLIAREESSDLNHCMTQSLRTLDGAFSVVLMSHDRMIAARDPRGFRPLVLGEIHDPATGQKGYVVSSESCAFDLIGAKFLREIEPGEMITLDANGVSSSRYNLKAFAPRQCVFEHVYFARPDSIVFGRSVYESRKRMGRRLAREAAVEADLVMPVPDSGLPAALGFAEESGLPFELGIIRNHYVGRTFIEPRQSIRNFGVKVKLNPQAAVLKGKRVVVVDDSLVRGTTSKKIVSLIRQFGALEVHLRISAPPTTGPCYYGVDTPSKDQLIAAHHSIEEIRQFVGADTLSYLSHEGLAWAMNGDSDQPQTCQSQGLCDACFSGDYPTEI